MQHFESLKKMRTEFRISVFFKVIAALKSPKFCSNLL